MERLTSDEKALVLGGSLVLGISSFAGTLFVDERLGGPFDQWGQADAAKEQAQLLKTGALHYASAASDVEQHLGDTRASEYLRGRSFHMYSSANTLVKDTPNPPAYILAGEMSVGFIVLPTVLYGCIKARRQMRSRRERGASSS